MPNNSSNDEECDNNNVSNSHTAVVTVILLAGLPASGKSTLARKLRERFNHENHTDTTAERMEDNEITRHRLIHIEYDDLEDFLLSPTDAGKSDDDDETGNRRRDAWNQARQKAVEDDAIEGTGAMTPTIVDASISTLQNCFKTAANACVGN